MRYCWIEVSGYSVDKRRGTGVEKKMYIEQERIKREFTLEVVVQP